MHRAIALLITIIYCFQSFSQQFGGHPPSTKWKQINTDTARIIFPRGLDSQAKRIATLLPAIEQKTSGTIGKGYRKVPIVLQPSTTISNAYVGLGPFRSEFQLTPRLNSFELGSLPWVDNLTIHEYRHVQQYNNFNRGLSKAFRIVFGEEGQALANGLAVPDWFFEGDAVYQETQLSKQGRGSMPFFFNDYRSLWTEGKNYSWMKLRNGSLRDFVPDHYRLGYLLTAYGYEKYGPEFWKKVSGDAASFRGLFYPWQKAVKRYAGISYQQFRSDALNHYRSQIKLENNTATRNAKHFVADEEYPYFIDENKIVYIETSYKKIPRFIIREGDQTKKIRTRDIAIDNYFSYRNGRIVYAAYRPDVRWTWKDYSDIKLLDVNTGKQTSVTTRSKYFAPDITADGSFIVAVNIDEKGSSTLHIINTQTGKLERKLPNTDNLFYTYPKFIYNQEIVSAVRNKEGQMSVAIVNAYNGEQRYILPFTWSVIGFPWAENDTIYFTASANNADRLFAWNNNQLFLVEDPNHVTGNYQMSTSNGKRVWTAFTATGFRLMYGTATKPVPYSLPDTVSTANDLLSQTGTHDYLVTDYSQSFKLFNFHSRRPYISDPDYSFSFVSQNILNTLETELSFLYNRNEKYKQIGFGATYGQLFPWIRTGISYTIDRNTRLDNNPNKLYWNELEGRIGFLVPLNLTSGRNFANLSISSDYVLNNQKVTGYFKDSVSAESFSYITNTISFSRRSQQARMHIYPRLAQSLLLNYRRAVTNREGWQFLTSGSLYLPGIAQTHNLVLQAAYHQRDTLTEIAFTNNFPFSRGYATANFRRMWKVGANYHFPLVYPDWGFANLVYFLRIRANAFYDFSQIKARTVNGPLRDFDFRSYGAEIYFDTKWWNQLPLSFGIRYSRLLDDDIEGRGPNQWEFILPINLLTR